MSNIHSYSEEINLLEYWAVIKKRRSYIAGFVLIVVIATSIISLLMPKYYKADAVIMPFNNKGGGGLAALAGSFGGLASLAGLGGIGGQTVLQQFIALLNSRTLTEDVINEMNLMPVLFKDYDVKKADQPTIGAGIRALKGCVNFLEEKKNGTISISGEFKDPIIAADVVNGYIKELQTLINENSFTMSKRNRVFIEKQLEQNKRELLESGKDLNEFYKSGKVSSVESKVDVSTGVHISADAEDASATEVGHKDLLAKVDELQKQKQDIESKLVVKDVPQQVYLQYLTIRRGLLVQINNFLTQQYEMAKIDEAKDDLAFQVIDPARVPEMRSRPQRKQMVMMSFMASLLIGVFAAVFMEYIEKMKGRVKGEI